MKNKNKNGINEIKTINHRGPTMEWSVIKSFFDANGFVPHQLHSYNDMIEVVIPRIIEHNNVISHKGYSIEFGELVFHKPHYQEIGERVRKIGPMECTYRKISYVSGMYIDIEVTNPSGFKKVYKKYHIGSIPVMVKSRLCHLFDIKDDKAKLASLRENLYDPGGYFIVNGAKKVVVGQERTILNQIYTFANNKRPPRFKTYSEVRSCSKFLQSAHNTTTKVGILKNGTIEVLLPYMDSNGIPLGIVFKALGLVDEEEMMSFIINSDEKNMEIAELVAISLEKTMKCKTQEDALHYIGRQGRKFRGTETPIEDDGIETRESAISYAKHLMDKEVLTHLDTDSDKKIFYIAYMTRLMLTAHMWKPSKSNEKNPFLDDRDHFGNKRIATVGALMGQKFYLTLKRITSDIYHAIDRSVTSRSDFNIKSALREKTMTQSLSNALTNNEWRGRDRTDGVSQTLETFNHMCMLAKLNKTVTPMNEDDIKIVAPRKLHGSQYGIICPYDTPEGKKVGLTKNRGVMGYITCGTDPTPTIRLIEGECDLTSFNDAIKLKGMLLDNVKIMVNGNIIGITDNPDKFTAKLRKYRRNGVIHPETSISYNEYTKEVHISTDAGRLCRPLFVVENGKLRLTEEEFDKLKGNTNLYVSLITLGYIDILDKAEEEHALVAFSKDTLTKEHTHCELHPSTNTGFRATTVPFITHNQSPRNAYQSNMAGQAESIPGTNYHFNTTKLQHVLINPQIPLATTKMANIVNYDEQPAGFNALIAVTTYQGRGQEDSLVFNADSVDRGLGMSMVYIPYEASVRPDRDECFAIPTENRCNKFRGNPKKLDPETFMVPKGTEVQKGDILIGRVEKSQATNATHKKPETNISVYYEEQWKGRVHSIQTGVDGKGYEYIRVVIAQLRKPVVGDKFSARHGQKGTIGKLVRSYDLPFTSTGITPDIIVNPLAFPSRMTIAMFLEVMLGKKICATHALNTITVEEVFNLDNNSQNDVTEKRKFRGRYSKDKQNRDATGYSNSNTMEILKSELKKLGYTGTCEEQLTNGLTGEPMNALIFFGPCYYQRLKHQVVNKIHSRGRGPRVLMTHQPSIGRKAGGGLRCGYMEVDCFVAHGGSACVKDRMMEQSDKFKVYYCKICGLQAIYNKISGKAECRVCISSENALIQLPYASKLVMQEMSGMNIVPRVLSK